MANIKPPIHRRLPPINSRHWQQAHAYFMAQFPYNVAFLTVLGRTASCEEIGRALRWCDEHGYVTEWNSTKLFFERAEYAALFKMGLWVNMP